MSTSHKILVTFVAVLLFAAVPFASAQKSEAPLAQATATTAATAVATAAATTDPGAATPAVLPATGAEQPSGETPGVVIAMLIAIAAAFLLAGISVYMLAQRPR